MKKVSLYTYIIRLENQRRKPFQEKNQNQSRLIKEIQLLYLKWLDQLLEYIMVNNSAMSKSSLI